MDATLDPLASRLLALMHEADTEAVTLDELTIAGVEDPARALHALELAGFTFERVTDRTASREEIECVRLARAAPAAPATRAAAPAAPAPPARAAVAPAGTAAPPRGSREAEAFASRAPRRTEHLIEAADRRPLILALLALVLVALLGHAVVGRRG